MKKIINSVVSYFGILMIELIILTEFFSVEELTTTLSKASIFLFAAMLNILYGFYMESDN